MNIYSMKLSPFSKSLIASLIAACCFATVWLYFVFAPVVTQQSGAIYYLRPGTSKKLMMTELSRQGVIAHPAFFTFYAYLHKNAELKSGEYLFPKGSSVHSIWKQMSTGAGLYYRPFALIPGWTFKQLRAQLNQIDGLKHFTANMTDQQIMAYLGAPQTVSPEGQFFPDTYNYTKGDVDSVILKRAYLLMQTRLNAAWNQRAEKLPYKDMYAALIVASLIEKEAYLDAERPVIADVIINRLHKNMLLQVDASVIYGLGDSYDGKIHKKDLLHDTPYNTYVNAGLPPTPIAMPSMASINAALHPAPSNYLYYVAKGDGSHQFSATLAEHNAAVAKWQRSSQQEEATQPQVTPAPVMPTKSHSVPTAPQTLSQQYELAKHTAPAKSVAPVAIKEKLATKQKLTSHAKAVKHKKITTQHAAVKHKKVAS